MKISLESEDYVPLDKYYYQMTGASLHIENPRQPMKSFSFYLAGFICLWYRTKYYFFMPYISRRSLRLH